MLKFIFQRHILLFSFILGLYIAQNSSAQILTKKYNLEGYWNFSVGDKPQWKNPSFDDSMWDKIRTGQDWESQGYNDYNGFAWYRKTIFIKSKPNNNLILKIGAIDDADQVFLNGSLIGSTGGFPPHPETAYDQQREYIIPPNLWKDGDNVIAIRVYDFYANGGIRSHPLAIYEDITSDYLTLDLSGTWHFKTGSNNRYKESEYNHSDWDKIQVPGRWEDQGWPYLDGIAWYRTNFYLPSGTSNENMYLILGRIDDEDEVYLNGKKIGETKNSRSSWNNSAYQQIRIYRIPSDLLSKNNLNSIAVKVYDDQLDGGIYEGPIGLATREQADDMRNMLKEYKSTWETFLEWIYD
ncbi:sugar-binding domain-containing protein [Carboxylicivirga linearis]|uniref:Beta galactosidase jelly roll domain-containing protein n=1 Tax=Carboxylicivirga linearis TaxID=1628157 RepID=A0ABS5K0E2_9BACT|nr:sugar-binding domain-containing protein [Carboxylicivirga linearis]MBS2100564.1 beta galactosidase jelly roll domain-containing protein [Carboxylicivirga linearis]